MGSKKFTPPPPPPEKYLAPMYGGVHKKLDALYDQTATYQKNRLIFGLSSLFRGYIVTK
jgi:hypothetical protein